MEELFCKLTSNRRIAQYYLLHLPLTYMCAQTFLQFHCAFIRYEKGLSVDEIWAIQAETSADVEKAVVDSASRQSLDDTGSVELTFEHDDDEAEEEDDDDDDATGPGNASATKSTTSEYEMVDDLSEKMDDEELDELDAEIAKELAEIDDL